MGPGSRDDFRVAIICALPLEAAAVLSLFDQRYDKDGSRYGKQEGDINAYSTGRIGRHDIVLVHMPGMGVYSATRVASNVRLSFKEIRLALVVGVCGGAPLERPIVLGDVIISDSIVEFYTGRQYSDGVQARKGVKHMLGRPSPEIRGLLSKLEIPMIRQELEDEIQQNLAELSKKSDTARYPGVEHDRLFAASYRHMHRKGTPTRECPCVLSRSNTDPVCREALESSCEVLGCDADSPENPSRRTRLASSVPTPLLHIGTIGATTVMKSGEHRDIIARENGVIGFEMEGAGIWEDLPCVIIKGVCDYADSHKNKRWQDYAAATAASAAKAFLGHWTSQLHDSTMTVGPSRKRPLSFDDQDYAGPSSRVRRQSLSGRQSPVCVLPRTDETSSNSPLDSGLIGPGSRQVLLDALNFEQLDTRHATIKTAHAATCEWLLSKLEYRDWQDEEKLLDHHGFLWIKGKPGAGKSTIMKFAYTKAKNDVKGPIAISYFFNARGEHLEKSTRGLYRSLLFQLLTKIPRLQTVLDTTEASYLQELSPDSRTTEILQSLFRQAIEKLEDQPLTCFVDALDECENNEDHVREMVNFFEELGERAVENKIRLLVCFSRRHYPHVTIDKGVELTLEVQQGHSDDITKYVNSKLKVGRNKRVEQIKIDVQKKSQGIFLWVVLVIPILQKAYDHGQVHALGKCLKDTPEDLNELFRDILGRDSQNMEYLMLCLRWILYAERPLSPVELYSAILSASETDPVTAWNSDDIAPGDISRFILSSSKGLAEPTRSKTPTVQFIHESVRDFLLEENGLAMLQLGIDCTSAGLIHDSSKEQCQRYFSAVTTNYPLGSSDEVAKLFPFFDYSIRYVFKHAELAASHGIPQELFLKDFPLGRWTILHDHAEKHKIRHYGTETSLLYILTEMNFLHLFRVEVRQSRSVNAQGGRYDFPIMAAAVVDNNEMLRLLLEHKADPNKAGKKYRHALFAAVDNSNVPAIEMLLENGAMSSTTDDSSFRIFGALLRKAVMKGQTSIVKLLLLNREALAANIPITGLNSDIVNFAVRRTDNEIFKLLIKFRAIGLGHERGLNLALELAISESKGDLVCIMLDGIADLTVLGGACKSLLFKAIRFGQENTIRMLLDRGADVNMSDSDGYTVLHAASDNGNETIVRMLLDRGADVNMSDSAGRTGLYIASGRGYETIVRLLLENGANVNTSDSTRRTGLHIASGRGYETVVRILLENGANIDAADNNGATVLQTALFEGHEAVVRLLLGHDASKHTFNASQSLALCMASQFGHETIVRWLIGNGADVNASDLNGNAPEQASRRGHDLVVQPLPLHHASDNLLSGIQPGPLWLASCNGHEAVVRILLEHGADANEGTPLQAALERSHSTCEAIMLLLLQHGADPNQYSLQRDLPLHTALSRGMTNIVKLLLEYGANVNIPSVYYRNAFMALHFCNDSAEHATCETLLLLEKLSDQSSVPCSTWMDGTLYLSFPIQISDDRLLHDPGEYQAPGDSQL